MQSPKDIKPLMQAINDYLTKNNLILPDDAKIIAGIDFFKVYIDDIPVLAVGDRPPTVIFEVHATEYTDRYLRPHASIAV